MHFDVTRFREYLDLFTSEQIEQLLAVGRTVIAERRTAAAYAKCTQDAINDRLDRMKAPPMPSTSGYMGDPPA